MLAILFTLLFSSNAILNDPSLDVSNIPESLLQDAHAVIRYESISCEIKSLDKLRIQESAAITILDEKGKGAGTVAIRYTDGIDKVKDITIEVFDSKGQLIKKVKKKEIIDTSVSDGFSIANDARRKQYTFVSNSYPYTIKYSYTKESKNTLWVPDWYPVWSTGVSVQKSEYKIHTEIEDYSLMTKEYNIEKISADIDYKSNTFKAENIQAIMYESYSPAFITYVPHVRIVPSKFNYFDFEGAFTDWKSYGKWMYDNMLTGRNQLPPSLIAELDKKIPQEATDEEKAKIIYDHVTKSTRYVSVQLGIGGFMPFKCADVYDWKYGDCKALSYYTASLLQHYGVDAIYTEINLNPNYNYSYDKTLPGPGQGNHIVLCLPSEGDTTWLECTSQSVLYGYTHDGINNRRALLIKPDGGELVQTKSYSAEENKSVSNINITLNLNANEALLSMDNKYHNYRHEKMRSLINENTKERNGYLKKYYYSHLPSLEIISYDIELDSVEISANEKAEFKIKEYVEKAGNYILVPYNIADVAELKTLKKKRKQDIYIKESTSEISTITIEIPEGYSAIVKKKSEINFENEFGAITTTLNNKNESFLEITIKTKRQSGQYPANLVDNYNEYINQRNKALSGKFLFKPNE